MFKAKFEDTNMNSVPVKASAAKTIRQKFVDQNPNIGEHAELIWPKKAKVYTLKFKGENGFSFIRIEEEIMFIEIRDKAVLPMLRVLHRFPFMMDQMVADKGAIRHIFSGSHVMAPGLTSEGGRIYPGLEAGSPVALMAEGKKHAMAIGYLTMSSIDIE